MKVVEYEYGVDKIDAGAGLKYYYYSPETKIAQVTFCDISSLDKAMLEYYYKSSSDLDLSGLTPFNYYLKPKKVIFSDPATVVFWNDGTKTVVKTQDGEKFDKEKGLAMCYTKKVLGNKGRYYDEIKKYLKDKKDD